ncbi:unnamed protein product [Arabidopsis thaliana]|uniref:Uncharacterized protein n=1 Tax=Arabidopsis thaliana TaxID=3702 RepID=A0A5S9WXG0_ARATH|nr:unnamed protein product [Arabidopsis thaliana]
MGMEINIMEFNYTKPCKAAVKQGEGSSGLQGTGNLEHYAWTVPQKLNLAEISVGSDVNSTLYWTINLNLILSHEWVLDRGNEHIHSGLLFPSYHSLLILNGHSLLVICAKTLERKEQHSFPPRRRKKEAKEEIATSGLRVYSPLEPIQRIKADGQGSERRKTIERLF